MESNNLKLEILQNISQLKEVVSNVSKSADADFLGYYEQMLRMQEYLLVEIMSQQPISDNEKTQEVYYTDNYGVITPESARSIISLLGSIKGMNQ